MKTMERIVLYGLFVILMIVFSFYDHTIILAMCDQGNMYGKVFALIGDMPFFWLCSFGGWICFRTRNKETTGKNIGWGILYGIFALICAFYGGWSFNHYMVKLGWQADFWSANWTMVISTLVYAITAFIGADLINIKDKAKARSWGMMVLYLMLWNYVMMMLLKFCWGRPRYRFIISDANTTGIGFVPWYMPNCIGEFDSNFSSFPSGHTIMSLGVIALVSAGDVFKFNKYRENLFMAIAIVWGVMVAVSRVVRGAHYPSDVTFGFFICLLGYDLMYTFVYPKLLSINRKRLANA